MVEITATVLAKIAATAFAGLFAGGASFVSMVQHPVLASTNDVLIQAPFFEQMYPRAARWQAPLALGSGLSAIAVFLLDPEARDEANGKLWAVTGSLMVAIIPYTVTQMYGINYQLMESDVCKVNGNDWMQTMLKKWGRLHAVRTVVSVAAFGGMVLALVLGEKENRKTVLQL